WPHGARPGGLLALERRLQGPGELWRRQPRHRRGIGPVDRLEERSDALVLLRRDRVQLGKAEEAQLALTLTHDLRPGIGIGCIPFVDRDNQRTARLENVPGEVRVLLRDAL